MFTPWISLPAKDIHVELPFGSEEGDILIMFKDTEVIDKAIELLEDLKTIISATEKQTTIRENNHNEGL